MLVRLAWGRVLLTLGVLLALGVLLTSWILLSCGILRARGVLLALWVLWLTLSDHDGGSLPHLLLLHGKGLLFFLHQGTQRAAQDCHEISTAASRNSSLLAYFATLHRFEHAGGEWDEGKNAAVQYTAVSTELLSCLAKCNARDKVGDDAHTEVVKAAAQAMSPVASLHRICTLRHLNLHRHGREDANKKTAQSRT